MQENKNTSSEMNSEMNSEISSTPVTTKSGKSTHKRRFVLTTLAVLVVAIGFVGLLYELEKREMVSVDVFDQLIDWQNDRQVIASVNGEIIYRKDIDLTITQLEQAIAATGNPAQAALFQNELEAQALDLFINTRLLLQQAAEEGVTVTDEEITAQIAVVEEQVGGPAIFAARIEELGITFEKFRRDIQEELTIASLLETKISTTPVTSQEVNLVYEQATANNDNLPPLSDVQAQITQHLEQEKEQTATEEYLRELRAGATIDISL